MGRNAKDTGGGDFTPAPVGTHVARCYRIIDIGTQHGEYQGKPNARNQVLVFWELPNESYEYEHDGKRESKPFTVSKFYTNSLNEKATLRADLESWRGRAFTEEELQGFDLENIIGKPCMVTVIASGEKKVKVSNVTGLPKGFTCPEQVNASESFWIEEWNQQKFDALSDGIKKLIQRSDEYIALQNGEVEPQARNVGATVDDSLPF